MNWSFSIARVAGIDVRIHVTFLLLLGFFGYMGYNDAGLAGAWSMMAFILLLFACVLLHEFGHALAARCFGIRTPDITLLPIGGVARLERMPRNPGQELVVALAGPSVNVVIAGLLFLFLGKITQWGELLQPDAVGPKQVLLQLMVVNVWLVVFNLIPAFPMDGGRVLRALLAFRFSYARATQFATWVGQGFAVLFAVWGLVNGQFLLLLVAVFVFMGARQENLLAKIHAVAPPDAPISLAMVTQFLRLSADLPRWRAREIASQSLQAVFPVIREDLHPLGWIERSELLQTAGAGADALSVEALVKPAVILPSSEPFARALDTMQTRAVGLAMVVNASGQLVGLVSLPALLQQAQSPLAKAPGPA